MLFKISYDENEMSWPLKTDFNQGVLKIMNALFRKVVYFMFTIVI
jgi:hypothetical protein